MAIIFQPKVGEVLECNFGDFKYDEVNDKVDKTNIHGRIPPEIVKQRMVVILNGKLNGGCLVVPISSSRDPDYIRRGYHIELPCSCFRVTNFYDNRERWAKVELIQMVSKQRLFELRENGKAYKIFLPREQVSVIQHAVVKAINANALLNQ